MHRPSVLRRQDDLEWSVNVKQPPVPNCPHCPSHGSSEGNSPLTPAISGPFRVLLPNGPWIRPCNHGEHQAFASLKTSERNLHLGALIRFGSSITQHREKSHRHHRCFFTSDSNVWTVQKSWKNVVFNVFVPQRKRVGLMFRVFCKGTGGFADFARGGGGVGLR